MAPADPVARFARLVNHPEERLDLGRAALAIAAGAEPQVRAYRWLAQLDRLAEGVDGLDGLRRRLFGQGGFGGFAGNTVRYYDPANSLLHQVLRRRLGIPITLSIVAMEVGRRSGVALEGIGMPGHFLTRHPESGFYLDAFEGGALLTERDCEARFRAIAGVGPEYPFGRHLLPTVSRSDILARVLANLKAIYKSRGDAELFEVMVRMRLCLPQVPRDEALELGESMASRGQFRQGAEAIEAVATDDAQGAELRAAARLLRARLN